MSDKHWRVSGIAQRSARADVDPVSVAVGSALKVRGPGTEFEANKTGKSGEKLSKAKTDMAKAVETWAHGDKLLVSAESSCGCAPRTRSRSS